jgi:glutathione S-transferase
MGSGASRGQKPALYIFPMSAPCRAVLMTMRAANIPAEIITKDLMKEEQKTAEFLKVHC